MSILAPVHSILAKTGLDAVVLVPGANFRRVLGTDHGELGASLLGQVR